MRGIFTAALAVFLLCCGTAAALPAKVLEPFVKLMAYNFARRTAFGPERFQTFGARIGPA